MNLLPAKLKADTESKHCFLPMTVTLVIQLSLNPTQLLRPPKDRVERAKRETETHREILSAKFSKISVNLVGLSVKMYLW